MQLLALLLAASVSMMANTVIAPALPRIFEAFAGEDPHGVLSRMLLTAPALMTIVAAPLAGLWGDHWKRTPILISGMLLFALFGSAGLWVNDLHVLFLSRLALGLAVGMLMSSSNSLMGDYYVGALRTRAMGYQGMANSLGGVVFMILGGALSALSWRGPFAVYLLGFCYAVISWFYLPEPQRHHVDASEKRSSAPTATRWGSVFLMYGTGLLGLSCFFLIPVNMAFLLQERMGMTGLKVGLVMSFSTLISAGSSMLFGKLKSHWGRDRVFVATFVAMALSMAILSQAQSLPVFLLALFCNGTGLGLMFPNTTSAVLELAAPHQRGRAMGLLSSFFFLGQFLSPLLTGLIKAQTGNLGSVFLAASGMLACMALAYGVLSFRAMGTSAAVKA